LTDWALQAGQTDSFADTGNLKQRLILCVNESLKTLVFKVVKNRIGGRFVTLSLEMLVNGSIIVNSLSQWPIKMRSLYK
jgi:hypothetical protein